MRRVGTRVARARPLGGVDGRAHCWAISTYPTHRLDGLTIDRPLSLLPTASARPSHPLSSPPPLSLSDARDGRVPPSMPSVPRGAERHCGHGDAVYRLLVVVEDDHSRARSTPMPTAAFDGFGGPEGFPGSKAYPSCRSTLLHHNVWTSSWTSSSSPSAAAAVLGWRSWRRSRERAQGDGGDGMPGETMSSKTFLLGAIRRSKRPGPTRSDAL
ncbi:hypothetical protein C8Q77DRAFT_171099 [Trametes polyzona]|nr:hypothetical protein C8Q77DRAFT_171099 [Trametes polyzona]